jgi:F-type H+-transporting ATPase subunit delta
MAASQLQLLQATDGAQAAEITGLADELFGVAALLGRESTLRRALADASTDAQSRENLARGLLESKVGARALPVIVEAVRARWSSPSDLVGGLEQLARTALLVQAERAGRLDAVEDELFRLGRIIGSEVDLERLLSDPSGDPASKTAVLDRLIEGKVEPVTLELVRQLVARPRGRRVSEGLEELGGAHPFRVPAQCGAAGPVVAHPAADLRPSHRSAPGDRSRCRGRAADQGR